MADRYFVTGLGSNDWSDTRSWSASPTLTPNGASIPTASDSVFFTSSATYTVTFPNVVSYLANCLDFTATAGSPNFTALGSGTPTLSINGNFDVSATTGGNIFQNGPAINFGPTSGATATLTINCGSRSFANGGTVNFRWNSGIATLTYRLLSNFSIANTTNVVTLTRGELDLNGYTLNCGTFTAANANSKSITSGTGGKIVLNRQSGTPFTISGGATTITGDLLVQTTNGTSSTLTIVLTIITNPISFLFTGSNYGLVFLDSANARVKDITFSGGYSGTWAGRTNAQNVSGNITLSPGMTYGASTGTLSLTGSSGTQTITTNGRTWDGPINVITTGSTVQLADALAMGTRALTLTSGTFDGGGYSITGSAAITVTTGSLTAKNINTARAITHTAAGALTFGANNTTGAYNLTSGTLNLAGYQLNCSSFASNNANVRTLDFGSGNITCTGTGTVWDTGTLNNLTVSGNRIVNISNPTATSATVAPGGPTEAQAISFNIISGTYLLTILSLNQRCMSLNFTGFSGTLAAPGGNNVLFGSLTLSSSMTLSAGGSAVTFSATTTGNTITTNGKQVNFPIYFNGVGGSWILQDALTMSASNIRQFNGTLDLNGKTVTLAAVINSYYTDPGTKDLTFNGGTIIATNDFNNATPTGFTTTAGTGVGKISIQKATGFAFTGGGSTYNCTISNDGAGALSISGNNAIQTLTTTVGNITLSGSNAITTITNAVQPVTFTFAIGTTQTITNWNVSGTAGNLVTVISSSIGTPATLSKASGTVSANYLSLRDSAATGGAAWYAGANSTNVSGNSGWIFANAPAGAFFAIF